MATKDERNAQRRANYAAHRAERAARQRAYVAAHPEQARAVNRRSWAKHREKRLAELRARNARPEYVAKRAEWKKRALEKRAGRPCPEACELCGGPSYKNRKALLHFDHDHKTGEFRGWLCLRCNSVLGLVGDDIELLDKLIVYLARSRRPKLVAHGGLK